MDFDKRVELPSVQEVFYGKSEPTFILNTDPYAYQRRPHPVYHPRELSPVRYRTHALVAPSSTQTHITPHIAPHITPVIDTVNTVHHPQGLVLSVPMCCEKCVEKVRKAVEELEGVRDVVCDQYEQKVIVSGNVDPEKVLRRVRRVKKKSKFWKMATQPLKYSGSAVPEIHSKSLVNAYRAPGYHTSHYRAPSSAYSRYLSPPRHYTSSYSRAYSSPYIDSAYRSGYVEPRFASVYDRFCYDDLEYSRFDRGTPYVEMNDSF